MRVRNEFKPRMLVGLIGVVALLLLGGCAHTSSDVPTAPSRPPAWNLSNPDSAVRSYVDWTTFAYRMINSDLASKTASPDEGVRVDSYVELLKEKGQGIDQHLASFSIVRSSTEGTHTLVATKETWLYRYFSSDGKSFVTPAYSTSYDVTYTVVKQAGGSWVVDKVDAKALDEVH